MSYIGRKRDPPSCISDEAVAHLVDALRELPPQESDEVAQAVALLWSSLIFHFRGLDGFLAADTETQIVYLAQLASCSSRLVRYAPSGKGHYFVAIASFTAYLLGWLGPRSEGSATLGTRMMSALVRGRALAYESTPGSRLSTSRRAA